MVRNWLTFWRKPHVFLVTLEVEACDWVKFNPDMNGFYLVNYSPEMWAKLADTLITDYHVSTVSLLRWFFVIFFEFSLFERKIPWFFFYNRWSYSVIINRGVLNSKRSSCAMHSELLRTFNSSHIHIFQWLFSHIEAALDIRIS